MWAALGGAAAALAPGAAAAHGAGAPEPTFPGVLGYWEFDPFFILPVMVAAWAYLSAVQAVNRAHPQSRFPVRKTACFLGGLGTLVLAIMSPLARYDTELFAAHMVQHLLILMVAAPLLLLGSPITLALRRVSPRIRKEVLLPLLHSKALRALSWPVLTWGLLAAVLWISHFSPLFNGALENEWLHRSEHALYLSAALLFWWPALNADPSPWRMNHPIRLLYLFMQMPQNSFLAVSIANATNVIFPHYAGATRTWGPSPLTDQEYAGYIMWVGGDLGFLVVLACVAYGWVKHEEKAAIRADRARAREKAAQARATSATEPG